MNKMTPFTKFFWAGIIAYSFLYGFINSRTIDKIEFGPPSTLAANDINVRICDPTVPKQCATVNAAGAFATTATLAVTNLTVNSSATNSIVDTTLTGAARVLAGGALSVGNNTSMPLIVSPSASSSFTVTCSNCATGVITGTITQGANGTWSWPVSLSQTVSVNSTFPTPAGTNVIGHIILDSGTITTLTGITNALPAGTNVLGHVILDASSSVIGHIILDSGSVTVTQATGTNLRMVMDSGTLTSITNALPTGSNTIGTVNQGTANSAANAWAAFITDGAGHTNSTTYPLTVLQGQTTATSDSVKAFMADGIGTAITSSSIGTRIMMDVACSGCAAASAVSINAGSNIMGAVTQSGAFTVDVVKIAGTTTATGNGVTGAGSQRVTIASDNTAFPVNATLQTGSNVIGHVILDSGTLTTLTGITNALPAGTNVIGHVILDSGTVTSLTQFNGQAIALNTGTRSAGTLRVTIATDDVVPASQSGTWTVQPGNTANTTPWLMTPVPATSGGWTMTHNVSAASVNAMNIKASAGQIGGWYIYNSNAAARKIAFHNTAGTPTAGSGVVFTIIVPPTSAANVNISEGLAFSTGIAMTTVTELTDAGNTAVAASDLIWSIWYK